jgi:1-acyl-sn-glycerol-3-phosphate acyltransferase
MTTYTISRALLRLLFGFLFRLEAVGTEHLKPDTAYILCPNHASNWDPPLVGTPLQMQVHYMAKAELFDIPLVKQLIRSYGTFPVNRESVGKQTIQTILTLLRQGKVICIFPEGSRNSQEARRGAATFALKTGTPVIPAAIIGSYRPFSKMKVVYGAPVEFADLQELSKDEQVTQATDRIMESIHQLIKTYN